MTPHINAKQGEINPYVLMPGDPVRAKFIADNFLENHKLVNDVRGMSMYSGTYKGVPITVAASGMGCPSIGIYSYELYNFYNVQCIIRVGTCGAYTDDIDLLDVINVSDAFGENDCAENMLNTNTRHMPASPEIVEEINTTAKELGIKLHVGPIHSSDVFYRPNDNAWKVMRDAEGCIGVEMESFALFTNAMALKKQAACLLTVADNFNAPEILLTPEERVSKLKVMMKLGCETILNLVKK